MQFLSVLHQRSRIALFHFLCAVARAGVQYLSCWNLIFLTGPWGFVTSANLCLITFWVLQPSLLQSTIAENARSRHQSPIWFSRDRLTVFPCLGNNYLCSIFPKTWNAFLAKCPYMACCHVVIKLNLIGSPFSFGSWFGKGQLLYVHFRHDILRCFFITVLSSFEQFWKVFLHLINTT